jgi:hypothetical protein
VPVLSDTNVAWMLADAADMCLTGHERTMTFIELGSGEEHLAIERILDAVLYNRKMLPPAILDTLSLWLDGYAGDPEEPHLRTVLAQVRAQQSGRVPAQAAEGLTQSKDIVPQADHVIWVASARRTRLSTAHS